jgi:hypothetical protein
MWGNSPYISASQMHNARKMYVSHSNRKIYYNHGNKDDFQVRVVTQDGRAYAMLDKDYFSVLQERYVQNQNAIRLALRIFTRDIDMNAGNFYSSIITDNTDGGSFKVKFDHAFNTHKNTFGYDTQSIKTRLIHFQEWFSSRVLDDPDSALEEALVVIYLGMIAEWYYVSRSGHKSKWQHRMKLLGIAQVLSGELNPTAASNWSKGKKDSTITPAMYSHKIFSEPYLLV